MELFCTLRTKRYDSHKSPKDNDNQLTLIESHSQLINSRWHPRAVDATQGGYAKRQTLRFRHNHSP